MKDLFTENYKAWMKETEDTNRKNIPQSQTGRINTIKMSILSKAISRFNEISIKIPMVKKKIPMVLFMEVEQAVLTFIWNHKKHPEWIKES